MAATPEVEVDVDSTERAEDVEQGPTRRRIETPELSKGERRRVVTVGMGEYEYDARCPKLVVWTDMAQIIAEQAGNRSDRRKKGDKAPAESGRVTVDKIRLTQGMTHFLRGCLTAADWEAIDRDLGDPDSDLDLPDLWAAGVQLVVEFKPDMQEMSTRIGMKVPGVLDHLADRIDPDTGEIRLHDLAEKKPAVAKSAPRKAAARGRTRG